MRNKIIEATIDHVIDESQYSEAFKSALKAFAGNVRGQLRHRQHPLLPSASGF